MRLPKMLCALAAASLGLAGCSDKCPTESPGLQAVQNCTVGAGNSVTVNVRVCEKCNQTGTTCSSDIQGNTIQLDPVSEACTDGAGCPIACNLTPTVSCAFTAPAAAGDYQVRAYNPANGGSFDLVATLTVTAGGSASCALP